MYLLGGVEGGVIEIAMTLSNMFRIARKLVKNSAIPQEAFLLTVVSQVVNPPPTPNQRKVSRHISGGQVRFWIFRCFVKNLVSVKCPLFSPNPTTYHFSNPTSANLILSPYLPKFLVFPVSGLCYGPYGLSPTLPTRKKYMGVDIPYNFIF